MDERAHAATNGRPGFRNAEESAATLQEAAGHAAGRRDAAQEATNRERWWLDSGDETKVPPAAPASARAGRDA
jgi:hypothetical protein